jgi:hypothetical protein
VAASPVPWAHVATRVTLAGAVAWSMGSGAQTTMTSIVPVAGGPAHGGGPGAGGGHALDAPDFDALGGLGLGASDLDTRSADTRSTGKWRG